jgi:membrane protein YdbS with pleckstrin-like domain
MDRTFHHRFTLGAACGIVLLLVMSLYAFWQRQPVVGAVLALGLLAISEQSLHKKYIFRDDKLIIDNGRLWRDKTIRLDQIHDCRPMTNTFGLIHYMLISYTTDGNNDRIEAVQPDNEASFLTVLQKRKAELAKDEQKSVEKQEHE